MLRHVSAPLDPRIEAAFEKLWLEVKRELSALAEYGSALPSESARVATQMELAGRLIVEGVHLAAHLREVDGAIDLITKAVTLGFDDAGACENEHGIAESSLPSSPPSSPPPRDPKAN